MTNNKVFIVGVVSFVIGIALSATLITVFTPTPLSQGQASKNEGDNKEPLYWVAPMDPNFKRDQPGQSPMGMDLVPVYPSSDANKDDSPGTIQIEPSVINNIGVRTAKAKRMQISESINAIGYVTYNEDTLVHIHPRVSGWVEKLYVKAAGEYIKKDAPLYALYSPELVNAQEEYLLALQRSNKNLINAAQSRLQALQMPKQGIDKLRSTKKIQHNVDFYAPQTGFVDNLPIRQGFFVQPSTTLMSIGALDQVWIDAEIMASQTSKISIGLPVVATFAYLPGQNFVGQIDYIYPSLQAETRTLRARVRINNPDYLLKPNMFANLVIESAKSTEDKLVVPSQSVIRTGQQNRLVMALGDGKFKSVEVIIGDTFNLTSSSYIEVLEGINDGDEIVVSAQFLLDSESSISSDFMRMSSATDTSQQTPKEMAISVWTHALIIEVMLDENKLTLDHGPLEEWGMPAMMMDFMVAEDIDMSQLSEDQNIHVEIGKHDSGMFEVITIHVVEESDSDAPMQEPMHGNMQHD